MLSTAPRLAHSSTSLLSLPNDILLLIYEEIHTKHCLTIGSADPLRIEELLINKRIFSLAQSIWFRRLTINASQLDLRLSNLHVQDARRNPLRLLSVAFTEPYTNLFKSVLLRLPLLTHLTLRVPEDISPKALTSIVAGIARLDALEHLALQTVGRNQSRLMQLMAEFYSARRSSAIYITFEQVESNQMRPSVFTRSKISGRV